MSDQPTHSPRAFRPLRIAAVLLLVSAIALAAFAYDRSRHEPAWWSDVAITTTPEQAETFEHALLAQLTRVRETDEPWIAALTESDLNAWLAHRLNPWLTNRGLASPIEPNAAVRVRLHANQVLIGVRTTDAFLWTAVRPEIRDNRLYLEPLEAGVGNLALPLWAFRSQLPASLNIWLAGGLPTTTPIDRARAAQLQELSSQPGQVVVTVSTFARP